MNIFGQMKKLFYTLITLFLMLHPRLSLVQEGTLFHSSEAGNKIKTLLQVQTPTNRLDLNEDIIDLDDETINEREKKIVSFHSLVQLSFFTIIRPHHHYYFNCSGDTQHHFLTESPLFLLHRVIRI